jgi:diguanylate cyclase (GGDEF)-like protein
MVGNVFSLPRQSWIVVVHWVCLFLFTLLATSILITLAGMHFFLQRVEPLGIVVAILLPLVLGTPVSLYLAVRHQHLQLMNARLLELACRDTMLNCLNRRAFSATADARLARASETHPCALLVIDADHFKAVNDKFGHDQGDQALQIIVEAIKSVTRQSDIIGRIGGEEFAILLPESNQYVARSIAERILTAVASVNFSPDNVRHQLTISIGITLTSTPSDFMTLFRVADRELYLAKKSGRNNFKLKPIEGDSDKSSEEAA